MASIGPKALILDSGTGAMTVVRSLGEFGVHAVCADHKKSGYAYKSKYCQEIVRIPNMVSDEFGVLDELEKFADRTSSKPIIYPMTDQYVLFVSKHRQRLADRFDFVLAENSCLERLINKLGMFGIAQEHGLPVPLSRLPKSSDELPQIAKELGFPCLLKTIYSHSPLKLTDNCMTKVSDFADLENLYSKLSAIDPDLMIQEYISGEDHNVHIFAGYFDRSGEPKLTFTGRKLRQSPIDFGIGSICECVENEALEKIMINFCKSIGYRGNIDVGLKWDAKESTYKVLDINPRLGMNHRTFVTHDKRLDLARVQYVDLSTGIDANLRPRLGRKWVVDDSDIRSAIKYIRLGRLGFVEWLRSYKGVEEFAFFSWRDWSPWLARYYNTIVSGVRNKYRRIVR